MRPRIDVTLRISGLFRDIFESQIALFDMAVRRVAALDEDDDWNPLAAARRKGESLARVFGGAPGTYGAGTAETALDSNLDARAPNLVPPISRRRRTPTDRMMKAPVRGKRSLSGWRAPMRSCIPRTIVSATFSMATALPILPAGLPPPRRRSGQVAGALPSRYEPA